MNVHNQMIVNLRDPKSRFHKRNHRHVKSIRRAKKTIDKWSMSQLETWLNETEHKNFKTWYKYHHMVEQALLVATPANYIPF